MNGFQIVFVLLSGVLALVSFAGALRGAARRDALFWGLFWAAAAVAIANPDLTVVIARFLGIGRGADLILYLTVVATGVGFLFVYARLRRLRSELTMLVRQIALQNAVEPDSEARG